MTSQASASVGANSTSDTVMPKDRRASARSRCGLIKLLTAVPSSKATQSSTGRGRDIRPSSPTVRMPIPQYLRGRSSVTVWRRNRTTRLSVRRSLGSTGLLSTSPPRDVQRLSATYSCPNENMPPLRSTIMRSSVWPWLL